MIKLKKKKPASDRLRTALIILSAAALALGILTYFIVFFPTGSYQPVAMESVGTSTASSTFTLPTSTVLSSSTATSTPFQTGELSSEYSFPYPVSWNEGNEAFAVTGVSLQQNQLTVTLSIQMGNNPDCVLSNLRIVTDENGDTKAPDSPSGAAYTFPDTQSCTGTPGAIYSEPVVFSVDPTATPFLLTTGGASNIFFQVATTTGSGLAVTLPSTSG